MNKVLPNSRKKHKVIFSRFPENGQYRIISVHVKLISKAYIVSPSPNDVGFIVIACVQLLRSENV